MPLPATKENSVYVRLDGPLTLCEIERMQSILLHALESGSDIALDLEQEGPCDLALVQLLCAAHLSAQRRGVKIALISPLPPAAAELLQRVGFQQEYSCGAYSDRGCLFNTGTSL